jgi:hypothetical protein
MMTSFAFILGLFPLVVATGASQLARRNVGTPVFGGMLFASFVGIFAIPPLYVVFQTIREKLRPASRPRGGIPEVQGSEPPPLGVSTLVQWMRGLVGRVFHRRSHETTPSELARQK